MPEVVAGTAAAVRRSLGRRDGRLAFLVLGVGYPLAYLVAVGHLSANGDGGLSALVVSDPLSRALVARRPFSWEPVARVVAGPVLYLFSPLNLLLAGLLGALVGLNGAVALVSYRAPVACGVERSAGLLAAVPALLSGAACCGPAFLLLVGLQASATLLGVVGAAVPLSVALLAGSLLLVGRSATVPGADRPAGRT
jgi:hypothetical protein